MKYLLDTHVILWAAYEDERLSPRARKMIGLPENQIIVSAASAWEIATKYRIGKLPDARDLAENFISAVTDAGYLLLPISVEHGLRAGRLPGEHRDPFDRMLCAQAIHEQFILLSADAQLDSFGARREW